MAVSNEGDFRPAEHIVSKKPRKHYQVPVCSQHWQLRSLISAENQNIVYFPGGNSSNHVQRLNTDTLECETIKLLTFAPRCLVAKNGWLCCGSEGGEFVAIRLDENSDDDELNLDLDPGARLPLGPEPPRDGSVFSLLARARRSNKSLVAKSMKLAKERVNCVTLWFPPTLVPASEDAYAEPVAVLSNNDRTVTMVSLQDFDRKEKTEPIDTITYPDFVNRAIVSPDGNILVAVLDDPYLYVHRRVKDADKAASRLSSEPTRRWVQTQRILLKSQKKNDRTDSRGSFAACFSSSGNYLAIGTQHGTISIFNATLLSDPDAEPLITTFQSSRPLSGPGAVRDMAFCPGPYDILAWTEDRGRVGFADMRTSYIVRQIVRIDEESDFEHVGIIDRNTIDPRLLEGRRERRDNGLASALGSNLTLSEGRRRGGEGVESLNHPLTANETMVLEAIQGDRRRRERLAQRVFEERSPLNTVGNSWMDRSVRRAAMNEAGGGSRESSSSTAGRTMGEWLGNYRDQRERAQERVRTARQLLRDAANERSTAGRRTEPARWMENLGDTVAAMREQRDRPDPSYLSVLEILQARERFTSDRDHDETTLLVPLVNQVLTPWEESAVRGTLATDHGVFEVPPSPDNTAGLAWSEDGRILFVGTQNGIYELHINVQGRKYHPSYEMR